MSLAANPTTVRLDGGVDRVTRVFEYQIDRGRTIETEDTGGGTATIKIHDVDGTLDPTNTGGTYYGKLDPLLQAGISRWNPVAEEWDSRFRGFINSYSYAFDPSQEVNVLTLELVDIFAIVNAILMQPGRFGDTPPTESAGQVFFDNAQVGGTGGRIPQCMGNAGIDGAFWVAFSGNVQLWETVYSPGTPLLDVCQEAADAEFKTVANLYPDRFGRMVFHGRLAVFDPAAVIATLSDPTVWDYHEWKVGDGAAVAASPSDTAHIRDFAFNRGLDAIVNQALATPLWRPDGQPLTATDIAGQLVEDLTSIGKFGIRSWSSQYLLTKTGLLDGADSLQATKQIAQYVVDNFKNARNRVTSLDLAAMRPTDSRAAANWRCLCKADISDSMAVTIDSPGGGGFDAEPHYVQGIHETCDGRIFDGVAAGGEGYDNVRMTFDLSPKPTVNPFPTA